MAALLAAAAAVAARISSNLRWEPCAAEARWSLYGAGPSEGSCNDSISQPTETSKSGKGEKRLQKSMKLSVGR